ncbi:hypothetical protein JZM24_08875 [Candidatus Sodalis endolongispinus]|uniref:Uncharacterized protein n=1 Tax=Candidatus Sodalis endolongispinus TaxID=2812662 RepID=A0ABS5YDL8_9GAMM|nr:hypothetical protein [Candidatus Sodalis endolongispinus]MBT9432206.1 hypothetical protein [Candidatus Sodalis endolongispinus]
MEPIEVIWLMDDFDDEMCGISVHELYDGPIGNSCDWAEVSGTTRKTGSSVPAYMMTMICALLLNVQD